MRFLDSPEREIPHAAQSVQAGLIETLMQPERLCRTTSGSEPERFPP